MKFPAAVLLLLCIAIAAPLLVATARATETASEPGAGEYAYLRKVLHVREDVARCVAAIDKWVALTPKYDTFLATDKRVISAKVDVHQSIFSIGKPVAVDKTVIMRAVAKLGGKFEWARVTAKCGLRRGRVVGVSLTPVKPSASDTVPTIR